MESSLYIFRQILADAVGTLPLFLRAFLDRGGCVHPRSEVQGSYSLPT